MTHKEKNLIKVPCHRHAKTRQSHKTYKEAQLVETAFFDGEAKFSFSKAMSNPVDDLLLRANYARGRNEREKPKWVMLVGRVIWKQTNSQLRLLEARAIPALGWRSSGSSCSAAGTRRWCPARRCLRGGSCWGRDAPPPPPWAASASAAARFVSGGLRQREQRSSFAVKKTVNF